MVAKNPKRDRIVNLTTLRSNVDYTNYFSNIWNFYGAVIGGAAIPLVFAVLAAFTVWLMYMSDTDEKLYALGFVLFAILVTMGLTCRMIWIKIATVWKEIRKFEENTVRADFMQDHNEYLNWPHHPSYCYTHVSTQTCKSEASLARFIFWVLKHIY